jgi:hypothetical protein
MLKIKNIKNIYFNIFSIKIYKNNIFFKKFIFKISISKQFQNKKQFQKITQHDYSYLT